MRLRLIRNATMRLDYAGHILLLDPFLAPKASLQSLSGVSRNPLVDLPCSPVEVIAGVEAVVVSHLHRDHFDDLAKQLLPKDLPLFCQPPDEASIAESGFTDIRPLAGKAEWNGITITRTDGEHGVNSKSVQELGPVSGFVFSAAGEPVVYWAGDSVWCKPVKEAVSYFKPDVVVTHSSGSSLEDSGLIVMDADQTLAVLKAAPKAVVVAVHMESLDHGKLSRAGLRAAADAAGVDPARLLIPADGEVLSL